MTPVDILPGNNVDRSCGKTGFPLDIFAVKNYGLERWRKEFFWPVPDKEVALLYEALERCWLKAVEDAETDWRNLLLIQNRSLVDLLQYAHAARVLAELKQRDLCPLSSDHTRFYPELLSGAAGTDFPAPARRTGNCPDVLSRAREVKHFFRYNRFGCALKMIAAPDQTCLLGGGEPDGYMRDFIFGLPRPVWPIDRIREGRRGGLPQETEKRVLRLTEEVFLALEPLNVSFKEGSREIIRGKLLENFRRAEALLAWVRSRVRGRRELFTMNLGVPFAVALAIAVKEKQGTVTSFIHGGNIGMQQCPVWRWYNFLLTDRFCLYSGASARLFEKLAALFPPPGRGAITFLAFPSREYGKVAERFRSQPPPRKIRKVMLVGFPMNQWRYVGVPYGTFSMMQLELELRIVDFLRDEDIDVIYKAHPDRLKEVEGVFEHKTTVRSDRFEDVADQADAFVFGDISTSTFGYALCTNKPVALVCPGPDEKFFEEPYALLKKRCRVIKAGFDERNRILFQEEDLRDFLTAKPGDPDGEFVEKYYLNAGT